MTLKTVPVTGILYNPDGSVSVGTAVVATLTVMDTDGGVVVPAQVSATTDSTGSFTLNLWPNSRGVNGSQYRVRANVPNALPGVLLLNVLITVPDSDPSTPVPIATITNRVGPAVLSDAVAAMLAAQGYALQAASSASSVGNIYPGTYATAPTTRPDGSPIENGDRYLNSTDGYNYIYFNGWTSAEKNAKQSALSVAFLYAGTYTTAPTTRPDGSAIQNGDRYNNSTDGYEYIRINGVWTNAASSAQGAAASAAAAATSASGAAASKSGADASATAAANYAAAAATGAKFFDTIALGLVGVTSGNTFGVIAGGSDNLVRPTLYRNDSGTATLLYTVLPASEYDAGRGNTLAGGFIVCDPDGNMIVRIAEASGLDITSAGLSTADVGLSTQTLKYSGGMGDGDGSMPWALDSTGRVLTDISATTGRQALFTNASFDFDISHVIGYGQSLELGQASPAISKTQFYNNLMFVDGMRPYFDYPAHTDAQHYASFVSAVEQDSPADATVGESPMTGAGDFFKQLMLDEDGIPDSNTQLLLSIAAQGATGYGGLVKGTTPYNRILTQVQYALANATALGKSYGVLGILMGHGESDYPSTTQAAYYAGVGQILSDLNTDIKSNVTGSGQTKNVVMSAYQVASHKVGGSATPTIALAQLQLAMANPLYLLACAMYPFVYQSLSNFHLLPYYSRIVGAYQMLALKRAQINGGVWKGLWPISSRVSGNTAYLKFNVPVGRLVLDTDLVSLNTNYGFEAFASDNATPIAITSVSVRGRDELKIVGASSLVGGHIHGGWSGTQNVGRDFGPRINLRDQQGEHLSGHQALIFDPNGVNYPMHNWCVIFDWSL